MRMTQQGERRGSGEEGWWGQFRGTDPHDGGPAGQDDPAGPADERRDPVAGEPQRLDRLPSQEREVPPDDRRQQTAEEGEWWVGGPVGALPREAEHGPAPEDCPEPSWLPRQAGPWETRPPAAPTGPPGPRGDDVLPRAEPDRVGDLVPDTVLEGGRLGALTLRAAAQRGEEARRRGEPRGEALLTARFGSGDGALLLIVVAVPETGSDAGVSGVRAAQGACRRLAEAVGREQAALVRDLTAGRHDAVTAALRRMTEGTLARVAAGPTASALPGRDASPEPAPELRCLLAPADPGCPARVFFGTGGPGLFRLRDGAWQELAPDPAPEGASTASTAGQGHAPSRAPFRSRVCLARPGDVLMVCGRGTAAAVRDPSGGAPEPVRRWAHRPPREPAEFLDDLRAAAPHHPGDRTAAALWEA